MSGQPTPPVILQPFGADAADPANIQLPIPESPTDPGRASFEEGFPPLTMTPVIAGGVPPFGQDMNGILYMVTANIAALQAGQPYLWNADVVAQITGYAKGTVLGMADGTGLWINQTDNNATNPDASGAGWVSLYRYDYLTLAVTGGTVTPTRLQAAARVIVLTGTLTANLSLVLPTTLQEWLIVNTTTGAFSTTVRTSAGTGVVVPQGGFNSPVRVYGDGTNLYPGAGTVSTPTDVNPTPNTIPLRDNNGYIYAVNFVQTNPVENPTVGAVFVEASVPDGTLRKINLTNLEGQMLLQNIGGVIVDAQLPYAPVQQWASALFTSPALTGVPTAPTPAAGDSSTKIATTAFVNPGQSQTGNGYVRLPGGVILQWGTFTAAPNGYTTETYPVAYASFSRPVASAAYPDNNAQDNVPGVTDSSTVSFRVFNANDHAITTFWMSIGV